jgi:uncharacterized membrane protein
MSKLALIGIVLIALGMISGFIQHNYYGYIDAEGVIHDSIFLPLAFFLTMIGSLLLLICMVRFVIHKFRKK